MKIWSQKLTNLVKNSAYLGFSVLFIFVGLGCASSYKKTTTETVVTQSNATADNGAGKNTEATVTSGDKSETTTTTTTTATEKKSSGHPGILSSTVHAIGWVISLPFRLVGALISWIF